MRGRLPYQPLVEALRPRLEAENAPEDLLEDLWLAELSRILPELRVRYPDLATPTEDELTARLRLFEAVARLIEALARSEPLVLLLDDLQWVDEASLDLLCYLSRHWIKQSSRVLLLGTLRSESLELNTQLFTQLADLGRELPLTQVMLQSLSRMETIHLVQAMAGKTSSSELETKLTELGGFLFTQADGHPLYLLETLKLLQERQWLVPRVDTDGVMRLELVVELTTMVAREQSKGPLLPPSVRADPGTPGSTHPRCSPTGNGQRCAGYTGDRATPVAGGRGGSASRDRGPGGSGRERDSQRGAGRDGSIHELSFLA